MSSSFSQAELYPALDDQNAKMKEAVERLGRDRSGG
jgi:hypothetical protein